MIDHESGFKLSQPVTKALLASRDAEVAELKARIKELEEPFAKLKKIATNMQPMPPEFAKMIDKDFWELLA